MRRSVLVALAIAAVACARPPSGSHVTSTAASTALATVATTPDRARALLSVLADDSMEGRGFGVRGSMRAARFISAQMRAIGLEPAGDSGYLQRMPIALTGSQRLADKYEVLPSLSDMDTVPPDRRLTGGDVVGVLPGRDPVLKNEIVVIVAHYDHLGIGRAQDGDSIYNGADDNGSGVVTLLEVARTLAHGPPPKRTVVFLAPTGEEWGELGSNWFVHHPFRSLDRYVAVLAIEMVGRPDSLSGGPGHAFLTGFERSTMGDQFVAAGLPISPDKRTHLEFFQRSDNFAFARMGVVAHALASYSLHGDYHRPTDELRLIDFHHLTTVITVTARAARLLVDGPRLEWKPGGRP